ncbi:MAG: hypothetical protein GF383_16810 [Candidatus Lokiarchaeota archaeon]|nr:hypothetical protein [Candidatus Lokiarchaeota archaeon]
MTEKDFMLLEEILLYVENSDKVDFNGFNFFNFLYGIYYNNGYDFIYNPSMTIVESMIMIYILKTVLLVRNMLPFEERDVINLVETSLKDVKKYI